MGVSSATGNGTCNSAAKLLSGEKVSVVRIRHLVPYLLSPRSAFLRRLKLKSTSAHKF